MVEVYVLGPQHTSPRQRGWPGRPHGREGWPSAVIKGQQGSLPQMVAGGGGKGELPGAAAFTVKRGHPSALSTMGSLTPDLGLLSHFLWRALPSRRRRVGKISLKPPVFNEKARTPWAGRGSHSLVDPSKAQGPYL